MSGRRQAFKNSKKNYHFLVFFKTTIELFYISKKLIVRPIDKDTKAEERFKAALVEAQQENDLKLIAELNLNYSNTPPTVNIL